MRRHERFLWRTRTRDINREENTIERAIKIQLRVRGPRLQDVGHPEGARPAEDDDVQERVGPQAVGPQSRGSTAGEGGPTFWGRAWGWGT